MNVQASELDAVQAARALVERDFLHCLAAFLAGSVVRGEATATSDLDIMIIVPPEAPAYRESLRAFGWPVEVFVQTVEAHREFAAKEAARRRPSTSMMACEGIVLLERDGWAELLKTEACALLEQGPPPLTAVELAWSRYGLTDLLDDFVAANPDDALFIANDLALAASDLILDYHRRWRGKGKWLLRLLCRLDPALAEQLTAAMRTVYREDARQPLVDFVDGALNLVGGRLWEGFRIANTD